MRSALKQLLTDVDDEFIPKLSVRLNLDEYVDKIIAKSTIVPVYENGVLNAFISFYCNDLKDHVGYLSMIVVKRDYRNKGVAQLLIEYAISFLQHSGFKYFRLEVNKQNVKALNLYKKSGFTIFQETVDVFLMEKKLI